jgi:hypothetical protein
LRVVSRLGETELGDTGEAVSELDDAGEAALGGGAGAAHSGEAFLLCA